MVIFLKIEQLKHKLKIQFRKIPRMERKQIKKIISIRTELINSTIILKIE